MVGGPPSEESRELYPDPDDAAGGKTHGPLWPKSWTMRGRLRRAQTFPRVARCGFPGGADPFIAFRSDGSATWEGAFRCESTWLCPVCTTLRRQSAATDIAGGLRGLGGVAQMLTLTIRHEEGTPLPVALSALDNAWREARHDGTWCRWWKERVRATARAVEVTRGRNGWHPHIHLLLVLDAPLERDPVPGAPGRFVGYERDMLAERWSRAAARGPAGCNWRPTWFDGVHVSAPSDVSRETSWEVAARYVCKAGLEIGGMGKGASSTSLWRIAERASRGDDAARAVWHEVAQSTRGRHAMHLDGRLRKARDEYAESTQDESARDTLRRVRVPAEASRALAWAERAWHPAALRVPLVLATQGHDVASWCDTVQRAFAERDTRLLTPWEGMLRLPTCET